MCGRDCLPRPLGVLKRGLADDPHVHGQASGPWASSPPRLPDDSHPALSLIPLRPSLRAAPPAIRAPDPHVPELPPAQFPASTPCASTSTTLHAPKTVPTNNSPSGFASSRPDLVLELSELADPEGPQSAPPRSQPSDLRIYEILPQGPFPDSQVQRPSERFPSPNLRIRKVIRRDSCRATSLTWANA